LCPVKGRRKESCAREHRKRERGKKKRLESWSTRGGEKTEKKKDLVKMNEGN